MSVSNHRIKAYETVHHLTSRIAHRVYFLQEEERDDFLSFLRRVTEFSGVRLLGWTIMTNHFHLMAYLPEPETLSDDAVRYRYDVLKGAGRASCELVLPEDYDRQRKRMYDIGNYMKMIKQWFSEDYNHRSGHKGTLWEAPYCDSLVPLKSRDMSERLAYLHLNPVRAAIATDFSGYPWSSFAAARKGDALALEGMRFVYGDAMTDEEMFAYHEDVMRGLLEEWKRRRAIEMARKRDAGFEVVPDALTDEAMLIQAQEQIRRAQSELVRLDAERASISDSHVAHALAVRQVELLTFVEGALSPVDIAKRLNMPKRMVYRCLQKLATVK